MNSAEIESTTAKIILPRHVAITPDGNRRWAKNHGKKAIEGHEEGTKVFKKILKHASARNVEYVSMWGMSLDNFVKRNPAEVAGLLNLFRKEFKELAQDEDIHRNKVHVNVLGRWQEKFPFPVRGAVQEAIDATKDYSKLFLNIFLAYSGTDEMLEAVKTIAEKAKDAKSKLLVTPELLKQHLYTKDMPPVDLLIRTGGEPHLSAGFMMWDCADSQLFFTEKYWPDFREADFDAALLDFQNRKRRFGDVEEKGAV